MCVNFLKKLINILEQFSFSLMLVDNDLNLIVAKMFFACTIITEKSPNKEKKIVSFMNNEEAVNFIYLKTINIEVIDIQVGKTLNLADLTGLEVESMKGAFFKDTKIEYLKLCSKMVVK